MYILKGLNLLIFMLYFFFLFSILLYTKVKSYGLAEAITLQWLAFPDNQTHSQYCSILELYIAQVLLPQGKVHEACQLVEMTHCLKPDMKLNLLKHLNEAKERLDALEKEKLKGLWTFKLRPGGVGKGKGTKCHHGWKKLCTKIRKKR